MPLVSIDDPAASAIASGVIFGRTEHVTAVDEAAFLDSGLWHLLAASGQNIALVAGGCLVLARVLGRGRVAGAVLALLAIPSYVLVVGGGASIVRAGLMGELVLVAWLAGRLPDARHLIVVAAAAITWLWPGAHRGLGMQLSFACVAALAWLAVSWTRWLHERGVPMWLAGAVSASVICSAATAPILVLRTGAAPVSGIAANILAVPLAGLLLVVGLVGSLLAAAAGAAGLPGVAPALLQPAGLLAGILGSIARRAADWPAAQTSFPSPCKRRSSSRPRAHPHPPEGVARSCQCRLRYRARGPRATTGLHATRIVHAVGCAGACHGCGPGRVAGCRSRRRHVARHARRGRARRCRSARRSRRIARARAGHPSN